MIGSWWKGKRRWKETMSAVGKCSAYTDPNPVAMPTPMSVIE